MANFFKGLITKIVPTFTKKTHHKSYSPEVLSITKYNFRNNR